MHIAIFLALVCAAVLAAMSDVAARSVRPATGVWLTVGGALTAGACWTGALVLLGSRPIVRLLLALHFDRWPPPAFHLRWPDPYYAQLTAIASLATGLAVGAWRARRIWRSTRLARDLRCASPAATELIVLHESESLAFALPTRPPGIVVSTGMLRALEPDERRAVLAHERAHLDGHHFIAVSAVDLVSSFTPLLRAYPNRIRFLVERCADEAAASVVASRETVARALAKSGASAARHSGTLHFHESDIKRRVDCLLRDPPQQRRAALVLPVLALVPAVGLLVEAAHDFERLLEAAIRLTS